MRLNHDRRGAREKKVYCAAAGTLPYGIHWAYQQMVNASDLRLCASLQRNTCELEENSANFLSGIAVDQSTWRPRELLVTHLAVPVPRMSVPCRNGSSKMLPY